MRTSTRLAGGAFGVIGLVGAVVGYRQIAPVPTAAHETQAATTQAKAPIQHRPKVKVRLAHCPRGTRLQGRACVRKVERTVVVDVPAPPTAPAPPAQEPPVAPAGVGGGVVDDGPGDGPRGTGIHPGDDQGDHPGGEPGDDRGDDRGDDSGEHEDDGDHASEGEQPEDHGGLDD